MRVDSWELPLSAISQLPCHLGPPRPTLSLNLYVKGCLDCTIGAFHMSIPGEPSLLKNEVQITQVVHWTWWWQRLVALHCRSVWSLPCHSAADVGGLVLSMAKSHWHGALRSTHKSCTHSHMSWKRGDLKRELVAAPWTSSRRFSHVLWLKVHSHLLLRACLLGSKRKLPVTSEYSHNMIERLLKIMLSPKKQQTDPGQTAELHRLIWVYVRYTYCEFCFRGTHIRYIHTVNLGHFPPWTFPPLLKSGR